MPNPGLTDEQMQEAIDAYYNNGEVQIRAAEKLGLSKTTYEHGLRRARALGFRPGVQDVEIPEFPENCPDVEAFLDLQEKRFEREAEYRSAVNWFRIKIKNNLPVGINWFGDPHLGSNGCNVKQLRKDIDLIKNTDGLYGANIGDTIDGWGDRMARLYADNDVSRTTEWKLAKWFLEEAGIPWILWLFGNHDNMHSGFTKYLKAINAASIPMLDWQAKFVVEFKNGEEFRVNAAHNHKGVSWFHELHGQLREAMNTGYDADVYMAGHHHNWALMEREGPHGKPLLYARCRGYKFHDEYADHLGFQDLQGGCSVVTVFNPVAKSTMERVRGFKSTAEGAEYLTWLRSRV